MRPEERERGERERERERWWGGVRRGREKQTAGRAVKTGTLEGQSLEPSTVDANVEQLRLGCLIINSKATPLLLKLSTFTEASKVAVQTSGCGRLDQVFLGLDFKAIHDARVTLKKVLLVVAEEASTHVLAFSMENCMNANGVCGGSNVQCNSLEMSQSELEFNHGGYCKSYSVKSSLWCSAIAKWD